MKVLLHGYFNTPNYGDIMYLKRCYDYYKQLGYEVDILDWKYKTFKICDSIRTQFKYDKKVYLGDLKNYDALIIVGGGTFIEHRYNSTIRFHQFMFPCLYSIKLGIPLYILSCDFGNLYEDYAIKYVKEIVEGSKVCNCRTFESYDYLSKIGCTNHTLTNDTLAVEIDEVSQPKNQILIHNAFTRHIPIIKQIADKLKTHKIIFLNDEDRDLDIEELKQYGEYINTSDVDVITNLIKDSKFIITTKLHVGVIGYAYKRSCVCIGDNYIKSHRFWNDIGESDRCVDLNACNIEEINKLIDKYLDKPYNSPNNIIDKNLFIINNTYYDLYDVNIVELYTELVKPINFDKSFISYIRSLI